MQSNLYLLVFLNLTALSLTTGCGDDSEHTTVIQGTEQALVQQQAHSQVSARQKATLGHGLVTYDLVTLRGSLKSTLSNYAKTQKGMNKNIVIVSSKIYSNVSPSMVVIGVRQSSPVMVKKTYKAAESKVAPFYLSLEKSLTRAKRKLQLEQKGAIISSITVVPSSGHFSAKKVLFNVRFPVD